MSAADEAPAYCMICNRPIATGPVCDGCARLKVEDDDFCARCGELDEDCDCYGTDDDDWSGMTRMERIDYLELAIHNGNLKDAVSFLMHDGDVRADSVRLALDVTARHILNHPANPNLTLEYIDRLNRLIDIWEKE